MTIRYILDTNTASYIIKGNVSAVRERLVAVPITDLAVSAVTEAELRYGVARIASAKRLIDLVDEFLRRVAIAPWDSEAAKQYAHIRAALEVEGKPMGNLDMMIGAHAIALGAI